MRVFDCHLRLLSLNTRFPFLWSPFPQSSREEEEETDAQVSTVRFTQSRAGPRALTASCRGNGSVRACCSRGSSKLQSFGAKVKLLQTPWHTHGAAEGAQITGTWRCWRSSSLYSAVSLTLHFTTLTLKSDLNKGASTERLPCSCVTLKKCNQGFWNVHNNLDLIKVKQKMDFSQQAINSGNIWYILPNKAPPIPKMWFIEE